MRLVMKVSFYPGCTLKTRAKNLKDSAVVAMARLGVDLEELPEWNCCGAVYSLAEDDLIHQVAPIRVLIRTRELGTNRLVTLCSMCYNTLARANMLMRNDVEKRKTINLFMDEEPDYHGEVEVIHLLTFLQREIGWDALANRVVVPLKGLRVASYYGCALQRPRDVAVEPPGHFELMNRFLETLGAEVVEFPAADLCCGSYQVLMNPEASKDAAMNVLSRVERAGAEALVLTCPLCEYNLGRKQGVLLQEERLAKAIPTFYITQLLSIALGLGSETCGFELNEATAVEMIENKRYLARP